MAWRVVERKIGRAGGLRRRTARQERWDRTYGEGNWKVGYIIDGEFVPQEEALESVYFRSYAEHFAAHPGDLEELIRAAKRPRRRLMLVPGRPGLRRPTPEHARGVRRRRLEPQGRPGPGPREAGHAHLAGLRPDGGDPLHGLPGEQLLPPVPPLGRIDYEAMIPDLAFRNAQGYPAYCYPKTDGKPRPDPKRTRAGVHHAPRPELDLAALPLPFPG